MPKVLMGQTLSCFCCLLSTRLQCPGMIISISREVWSSSALPCTSPGRRLLSQHLPFRGGSAASPLIHWHSWCSLSMPAGEAIPVLRVQQGFQPEAGPGWAQEDAHRRKAFSVWRELGFFSLPWYSAVPGGLSMPAHAFVLWVHQCPLLLLTLGCILSTIIFYSL